MSTGMSLTRVSTSEELSIPTPAELPDFVPYACMQLQLPFTVRVEIEIQEEYASKEAEGILKKRKGIRSEIAFQEVVEEIHKKDKSAKRTAVMSATENGTQMDGVITTYDSKDDSEFVIKSTLNTTNEVLGVTLERLTDPPPLLIKVVALCLPYCSNLTTLTVRLCKIHGTILYEIAKALPQSQITDLILDDSPLVVAERCYNKFFEQPNKVRSLSLARCDLSDEDCAVLVSCLVHPLPASKTLKTLDLTGNFITDIGARSISECLRSNRSLKYLNLAGNQIGEDGAAVIFEILAEFPLTYQEIQMKKKRLLNFLKMRQEVFNKFYEDMSAVLLEQSLDDVSQMKVKRKTPRKKPSSSTVSHRQNDLSVKAEIMTRELLGTYFDPFDSEQTVVRNNYLHCIGNMSLCYLNLAYNNLSYLSLKKLLKVVKYQGDLRKTTGVGLLSVQLEGNNFPDCIEMYVLQDRLDRAKMTQIPPSPRQRSKSIKGTRIVAPR